MKNRIKEMRAFFVLWPTQALSQLGSAMTSFALTLWLFERTGSALAASLLSICSYAPYVLMSIFAGALSDRWSKKTVLLVCDALAACCTLALLVLLRADALRPAHMYVLNAVTGLMNTVQQPAGDVAMTLIVPKEEYGRTSGLRSFFGSLVTVLHPVAATALFALAGLEGVIYADLATFAAAFLALLFFVRIPEPEKASAEDGGAARETLLESARSGLRYLRGHGMILRLILFLAAVNLVASAFDAALVPFVLLRESEATLGAVTACAGIASLAGSLLVTALPAPRDRIRTIVYTLLLSLTTENFILAFSRSPVVWCAAQFAGWFVIPVMNSNLDVVTRSTVPTEMQGRVYSCRNTLQFFTIPIGTFLGGFLVDRICEPLMASAPPDGLAAKLFGAGAGSGASLVMFLLGIAGAAVCAAFAFLLRKDRFIEPTDKTK